MGRSAEFIVVLMNEDLVAIVGKDIWLEYFDQNVTFERAFTPQYCNVLERHTSIDGQKDWYLVNLAVPVRYKEKCYEHLMIRSRWVGCPMRKTEPTAVFIVLVPDPTTISQPFEMDRSLYIAWGFAALDPGHIKR
jgi:hypothetical protein